MKEETIARLTLILQEFGYIILASRTKLKIGERIEGATVGGIDSCNDKIDQPMHIVREASREEIDRQTRLLGYQGSLSTDAQEIYPYYYVISTD